MNAEQINALIEALAIASDHLLVIARDHLEDYVNTKYGILAQHQLDADIKLLYEEDKQMTNKTNNKENNMNNEITINGTVYVPKSQTASIDGMEYVIVRTYSAGVHAGYLESRNGKEVVLRKSRRIWYWKGAASLSQMAVDGVSCPNECKFSVPVNRILLTEAIEIIPCTVKATCNITGVPEWKA